MLSKHPERCRFPHGHTRKIEVVVESDRLDDNDMVVDFKALKLAVQGYVERYDHAMAINSNDPLLPALREIHPDSIIEFTSVDPTTEVIAKDIFDVIETTLANGFEGVSNNAFSYRIAPGAVKLQRVRVWETPSSWAEYGR